MYINEWRHGCRVTVSDWIGKDEDGQTPIRIGVEYFKPGASAKGGGSPFTKEGGKDT